MIASSHVNKRELIKAQLRTRGISLSQIGRELGLKPSTVSSVLAGARSLKVEQAIASALNTKPELIWPERYPKMR
ncbi:helix-turn-helix domain-containing protein [Aliiroseovarius sp. 2305UL8-7]|uniref:helix-turn-helix domain-containing protein n=1 Tax=Aliiroseovarius conchicola TaxID=3121637 RepID=UPI003528BF73